MKGTPRTFVGTVVLVLDGSTSEEAAAVIRTEVERMDGVSFCEVDPSTATVVITAQRPMDRTDLVAALDRLGHRVRP